jgi:hypothetical protein
MSYSSNKKNRRKDAFTWRVVIIVIFLSLMCLAELVMSIVALSKNDNDTKYVIPDTSAIIPFYNTTFSSRLFGTASNSANVTLMLEVKGNTVTIEFPLYKGNCSVAVPTTILATDQLPLEYVQLNASLTSQVLYSPQQLVQVDSGSGVKIGLAVVDNDRRLYVYYDLGGSFFSGDCYVYPFTLTYFRYAIYDKTAEFG